MTTDPRGPLVSSGWQREWDWLQRTVGAPREPLLGCSTVSHERLGFCSGCVPSPDGYGAEPARFEVTGWRLLALKPPPNESAARS